MKITKTHKEAFAYHVNGESLELSIEWIRNQMKPNDVFAVSDLTEWVGDNTKPVDVFSEEDLEAWALANGFVKF